MQPHDRDGVTISTVGVEQPFTSDSPMSLKRPGRFNRLSPIRPVRNGAGISVTPNESNGVTARANEHSEAVDEIRQELRAMYDKLAAEVEKNRRTLDIQFARIAQLQQEIDALKRRG